MPRFEPFGATLLLLALASSSSTAAEIEAEEIGLFDRLGERERILETQRTALAEVTRQRTLFAYRLLRRRDLGFAANPEARLEDARALDLALAALGRASDETRAIARELERVQAERDRLEDAVVARTMGDLPADEEALARKKSARLSPGAELLKRPVRGVALAVPGLRTDRPTGVELRHENIELLTRLNEPVHALGPGIVRRVEALSQGGFAIVTAHPGGFTSIVSGLRDIAVKPGSSVEAGQTVGLAGRTLDGATVISVELWHKRRPADAAKLLHVYM